MSSDVLTRLFENLTSLVLVSLLAAGSPGMVMAASHSGPETASTSISVASDPEGAMVYLDGVARGLTPVELAEVKEGGHRVTILKDGYIENSQLVTVQSGKKKAVAVSLTESAGARYSMQVSESGGGGKKWPLILAIAGGGGAAGAYFLLRDQNKPPVAGTISVNPAGDALMAVTSLSFSSNASDPDNDTLTYNWDFGDGSSGSGQTTNHTYQNEGAFSVSLTVDDGKETATTSSSATVRSLSGGWSGKIPVEQGSISFSVDLKQSGTALSGTFRSVLPAGTIAGHITAPDGIRFTLNIPGYNPATFTGTIKSSLNDITGVVNGSGFVNDPFTMTR